MSIAVTACICTHNPNRRVLGWCLDRLRAQNLSGGSAELLIIDNASDRAISVAELGLESFPYPARVVREEQLGLSHARISGAREAKGEVIVFVDDDNLLDPNYLSRAAKLFAEKPRAGAAGGRSAAMIEGAEPPWFNEHAGMLAVADHGPATRCLSAEGWVTPTGAGMVVRKSAMEAAVTEPLLLTDRRGRSLSSGGDTELCCRIRGLGWELWYDPELRLDHFLPPERLKEEYLERLSWQFGLATPYIEFYSSPRVPWRRTLSLRRSFFHFRQGFALSMRSNLSLAQRLNKASHLALAVSLFKIAMGPALWKRVERFATLR